jgi:hypothetical protein
VFGVMVCREKNILVSVIFSKTKIFYIDLGLGVHPIPKIFN